MKHYLAFLIVSLTILSGCATFQNPTGVDTAYLTTCGKLQSVDAKYCYSYRQGQEIKQTLIYQSGLGDDEQVLRRSLFDQTSLKEIVQGLQNTAVITISFGRSYLVTNYPERWKIPKEATVDHFRLKILPEISMRFQVPKPWTLAGHSRGAQDTATLCLNLPSEFDKCLMLNPMIGCDDIYDFLDMSCLSSVVFRSSYTKSQWETYGQNAMLQRAQRMPPTLVTACAQDKFKLYEPTKDWVAKAQLVGLPVVFAEDPPGCSHQTFPVQQVLAFLKPAAPIIADTPMLQLDSEEAK